MEQGFGLPRATDRELVKVPLDLQDEGPLVQVHLGADFLFPSWYKMSPERGLMAIPGFQSFCFFFFF